MIDYDSSNCRWPDRRLSVELFEARKPREAAIMAEINGIVKYGEISKGQRRIYIVGDDGQEREYSLPRGVHINV